eukprot:351076-Chlamydomonas_euryale.AAC.4
MSHPCCGATGHPARYHADRTLPFAPPSARQIRSRSSLSSRSEGDRALHPRGTARAERAACRRSIARTAEFSRRPRCTHLSCQDFYEVFCASAVGSVAAHAPQAMRRRPCATDRTAQRLNAGDRPARCFRPRFDGRSGGHRT